MKYRATELTQALRAVQPEARILDPSAPIDLLATDSRRLLFPARSVFIALRGDQHDGHRFLQEVYDQGVRNFIVDQPIAARALPAANLWQVRDSLQALQALARAQRERFQGPVIGITGSNGKTIVKEWLYQILHPECRIARSPYSFNSQVGVPLSLWDLEAGDDLGIFEAGISTTGEMQRLQALIQPSIGVFTNLGDAHREGFRSKEEKLQEKLQLFHDCPLLFCHSRDPLPARVLRKRQQAVYWIGHRPEDDLQILTQEPLGQHCTLRLRQGQRHYTLLLPFRDQASIDNALLCWAVARHLRVPAEVLQQRLQELQPLPGRLEIREGREQSVVINDAYNADLTSLSIALQYQQQHAQGKKRMLIMSDLQQTGRSAPDLYRQVADILQAQDIYMLIGVGQAIRHLRHYLPAAIPQQYFDSTEKLREQLSALPISGQCVLLKGARVFRFERLFDALSRQAHRTVLEVNLSAMGHNLRMYHRLLHPQTRMMVMVKAAAYGSGSTEVARLLAFHKVDYLGVAYTDEGVELRRAGVQLPIVVLNPEKSAFPQLLRYNLEPEVYSMPQLRQLHSFFAKAGRTSPLHINLDTGMHRLGFEPEEIPALVDFLKLHPELRIQSLFTHLAASDEPEHDGFTEQQLAQFSLLADQLEAPLPYRPLRHALNSNGISRFPGQQMDMVRLGIGIYGLDTGNGLQDALHTVLSLKATVSQIKTVAAGESVGYSRMGRIVEPRRIATLTVGYADGLPRAAGNGRYHIRIGEQLFPTIGNICMDMCMVDITAQRQEIRAGDTAIIFGEDPPVDRLAELLDTIPYEIFTSVSARVKRVYVQE